MKITFFGAVLGSYLDRNPTWKRKIAPSAPVQPDQALDFSDEPGAAYECGKDGQVTPAKAQPSNTIELES